MVALSLFAALLIFSPAANAAGPITVGGKALVTNTDGDTIRVREGAGTQYKQVAEAHEGQTVAVLAGPSKDAKGNLWYKVDAPNGSGWVLADFLAGKGTQTSSAKAPQAAAPASPKLAGYARVANTDGDALRVRGNPSTKGSVVANLDAGTSVAIKQGPVTDSDKIAWYQVTSGGVTGWVMGQYLTQAPAPPQAAA